MNHLRIVFTAGLCLALGACGFRPLYGRYSANPETTTIFASTYVDPIPDRVGYELRNTLIDQMGAKGTPNGALYRLRITYRELQIPIAVQNIPVGTITETITTRYNYTLNATYELTSTRNAAVIAKGIESALASYNVTAQASGMYATESALLDSQKRAADDIAIRLRTDLAVFFANHPGPVVPMTPVPAPAK